MWDATKCDLCGDCLVKCQYVDYDKDKAAAEIKLLMEGKEAEILSKCITCIACSEYCPTGADPYDLICKMQEKTDSPASQDESTFLNAPYFKVPSELISGNPDKPVLSLCITELRLPDGAIAGQLFEGMPVAKGGEYFCWFGMVHFCKEDLVMKHAKEFIDKMGSLGRDIVFLHDDCYTMVDTKVKEYGITVPFKYMHLFEYLRNYLRDHRSSITKLGKKVAYQRPCASRYTPEKDVLLDEIFELIGVERPQRKYDRERALCCCAPIASIFPELAAEVRARNLNDAIECGSDALITLCPFCHGALQALASQLSLTTIFITDLCRMALGEKSFPSSVEQT